MNLKDYIRSIPDYPKKGILFRDITTLIKNESAFATGKPSGVLIVKLFIEFLISGSLTLLTNVFALQIATLFPFDVLSISETSSILVSLILV